MSAKAASNKVGHIFTRVREEINVSNCVLLISSGKNPTILPQGEKRKDLTSV